MWRGDDNGGLVEEVDLVSKKVIIRHKGVKGYWQAQAACSMLFGRRQSTELGGEEGHTSQCRKIFALQSDSAQRERKIWGV